MHRLFRAHAARLLPPTLTLPLTLTLAPAPSRGAPHISLYLPDQARLLPPEVAAKGLRLEWLGHRTRVLGLESTVLD